MPKNVAENAHEVTQPRSLYVIDTINSYRIYSLSYQLLQLAQKEVGSQLIDLNTRLQLDPHPVGDHLKSVTWINIQPKMSTWVDTAETIGGEKNLRDVSVRSHTGNAIPVPAQAVIAWMSKDLAKGRIRE